MALPRTIALLSAACAAVPALAAADAACRARSGAQAATVVELYTSEGCSSCPPADRWLSRLKSDPAVVPLAFHVNYWDRLGWPDRFSTPQFTQRQGEQQAVNGARVNYTPQVVVQGRDQRDWYRMALPLGSQGRATVDLTLTGDGSEFTATVQARSGAPRRLAAFWAVTEDAHRSAVTAGENAGERLVHDAVVRELLPVPAWSGAQATLSFRPAAKPGAGHPRAVSLVVTDAATGRPVQALRLPC